MVRPPYNNRFNPPQRGRHTLCSVGPRGGSYGKGRAEPPLGRPFQAGQKGATASRVNRALYGQNLRSFGTKMNEDDQDK